MHETMLLDQDATFKLPNIQFCNPASQECPVQHFDNYLETFGHINSIPYVTIFVSNVIYT